MLKLHDFECPKCNYRQEALLDIPPAMANIHCKKCGTVMNHVVIGGHGYVFKPFWHPHLDHQPVYIDSWRTFRKELQKRNLSSPLGS